MPHSPGDIVLVPHAPFSNQMQTKARPALILSTTAFNGSQSDVICAAISSQIRPGDPYRVDILDASPGFAPTGLKRSSCVKCGAIFAYAGGLIHRRLGTLQPGQFQDVQLVLRAILGL